MGPVGSGLVDLSFILDEKYDPKINPISFELTASSVAITSDDLEEFLNKQFLIVNTSSYILFLSCLTMTVLLDLSRLYLRG